MFSLAKGPAEQSNSGYDKCNAVHVLVNSYPVFIHPVFETQKTAPYVFCISSYDRTKKADGESALLTLFYRRDVNPGLECPLCTQCCNIQVFNSVTVNRGRRAMYVECSTVIGHQTNVIVKIPVYCNRNTSLFSTLNIV